MVKLCNQEMPFAPGYYLVSWQCRVFLKKNVSVRLAAAVSGAAILVELSFYHCTKCAPPLSQSSKFRIKLDRLVSNKK